MCKLVFDPSGRLLDADTLAEIPGLVDPREQLALGDEYPLPREGDLQDFCLSLDGGLLVTANGYEEDYEYRGFLRCWANSGLSWEPMWAVPSHSFGIHAVTMLPRSWRAVVVEANLGRDSKRPIVPKYSSLLTIRDGHTGELLAEAVVAELEMFQQLAAGGVEPTVVLGYQRQFYVYNPAELTADPRVIETEWSNLRGMVFHPSGRFLLTIADGPRVSIWDTERWQVVQEFDWEIGKLYSVGVSMDGCLAAVGSNRGIVTVWDWEA
jgi:WD40 repeat protein